MAFDIKLDDADLPVLSLVATQALTLIDNPNSTARELEALIRNDASLTSKVLRIANSPIYGGRVKISSIGQAVVRLGMTQLKSTVLMAATGAVFNTSDSYAVEMWEHSIATSTVSRWLASAVGGVDPEDAFVAGMLHDIGKVFIYNQAPEGYRGVFERSREKGSRFYKYEHTQLEYTSHESVGALMGRKWDLSNEVVEVIRFHHDIEEDPASVAGNQRLVALVAMANLFANHLEFGKDPVDECELLESPAAEIVGFDTDLLTKAKTELPELLADQVAAAA